MAIIRSIYAGVSGLRSHQTYLDLIGNNVANVNTVGFKAGRITFKEVFALQLTGGVRPTADIGGTNPLQLGLGTAIGTIDTLFEQGTLESTGQVTDIAIQGDSFFIVKDNLREYFTRAGAFQFDATGALVNPNNGTKVQGQLANSKGVIPAGTKYSDIVLPYGQKSPAKATTFIAFTGNLDAGEIPKGTILEPKRVYALELGGQIIHGGDTNIQNCISRSTGAVPVVTKLDGIVANSTTVTILDGIDRNGDNVVDDDDAFNFTYVATDTDSAYDFNSLQDLVDGINTIFGATGQAAHENQSTLSASFADGQITFTINQAVNEDRIAGFTIKSSNGNLQRSLSAANIALADIEDTLTSTTDIFSHIATDNDLLINLRNGEGASLGLEVNDEINMTGKVGGVDIVPATTIFTIGADTKYSDFMDEIQNRFSISTSESGAGVEASDIDGALVISGNGGTENELSGVDINVEDNEEFNAIFDSRPNNYTEKQAAADVQTSSTATVFDSLGQQQVVTITFTKSATVVNKWAFEVSLNEPAELSGGSIGNITFNTDGSLARFEHSGETQFFTFDPKTGANVPTQITIDAGTIGGFGGITQLGTTSSVVASGQNGYTLGELESISIDREGKITGAFSNGVNQLLAQLALARFNNPAGLSRVGDNNFVVSANSGDAIIGQAGTSFKETVLTSGALEQSNVDLAREFTNMIIAQRGFQASARVVTISDQILTEIVDLKR